MKNERWREIDTEKSFLLANTAIGGFRKMFNLKQRNDNDIFPHHDVIL